MVTITIWSCLITFILLWVRPIQSLPTLLSRLQALNSDTILAWFIRTRAAHWTNCLVNKVWFLQSWPTANPKSCSNYEVWCHDSTCKPRNNNWIFNIWEDADLIWFFVILNFFMPFSILYLCCICIGMSRSACHQIWSESSQSASLGFIHHDNSNKWWGGDHLTSLYC